MTVKLNVNLQFGNLIVVRRLFRFHSGCVNLGQRLHNYIKHMQKPSFGVTPPISTATPSQKDLHITQQLIETLTSLNQYEKPEEATLREYVLAQLNNTFKEFVKKTSLKKHLPETIAQEAGGKIFTFGSYRLGVHGQGADIDTLCVAPVHVNREDFFDEMYEMLKQIKEITELQTIPDAYVPVMNFLYMDIPVHEFIRWFNV